MARRPRPGSRERSGKEKIVANVASSSKFKLPLPKATAKRDLEQVSSESGSDEEKWEEEEDSGEDQSSDSDEEGTEDDLLGDSDEDGEGSDVDVDAPRAAQWIDEEDLEQPETPSGEPPSKKTADLEDIVRFSPWSTK